MIPLRRLREFLLVLQFFENALSPFSKLVLVSRVQITLPSPHCQENVFTLSVTLLLLPLSLFLGFPYEKVRERTLYLQVLDYDRFSRNDPIGEVSIPLNKVELGQIKTFWKELKPCSDGSVREGGDGHLAE